MKTDYPLTEKEVEIYRYLYYKKYKPLKKEGLDDDEIQIKMEKDVTSSGWTWETFLDYKSIDLMQRLVFEYSHETNPPMKARPEYANYDPNNGALRLKDGSLTEDPDKIH